MKINIGKYSLYRDQLEANHICLNCGHMIHSRADYYKGICHLDGHKIDNVRNHDHCRSWCKPKDYMESIYSRDIKDVMEVFS